MSLVLLTCLIVELENQQQSSTTKPSSHLLGIPGGGPATLRPTHGPTTTTILNNCHELLQLQQPQTYTNHVPPRYSQAPLSHTPTTAAPTTPLVKKIDWGSDSSSSSSSEDEEDDEPVHNKRNRDLLRATTNNSTSWNNNNSNLLQSKNPPYHNHHQDPGLSESQQSLLLLPQAHQSEVYENGVSLVVPSPPDSTSDATGTVGGSPRLREPEPEVLLRHVEDWEVDRLHNEHVEGLNGNYDPLGVGGIRDPATLNSEHDDDDEGNSGPTILPPFKEWHETITVESYGGDPLLILPYTVIDY